ncbi:helix-turn-helix transcriptional regulator [Lentibacillus sp. Marseille-P4043]|uniref:helix-turn-helix transcriptional regulator n=1 Tax=Lentibacillus sp. Marseille-P4043 TaxID=2040293 RepID=UPI000D0B1BB5|nr:PAS domain-containing protein [Lentibacillus sp. Marseille-P4043]
MERCNQVLFDFAKRTADMLVATFGSRCEVAVHDFGNLEKSLVHIAGNVTGREIGSPVTDLVLNGLKKPSVEISDIPNYKTQTKSGNVMKSSTIYIWDLEGKVIGALCINYDISLLMQLNGEIQDFISFDDHVEKSESFFTSVQDAIQGIVDQVLQEFKKAPSSMDLEEKVEFVSRLENRGTFLIKGAAEYVASVLGVSKFTIYNYLQRVRTQKEYLLERKMK